MTNLTYCEPVVGIIRPSVFGDCIRIGQNLRDQDALEVWNYERLSPIEATIHSFKESVVAMTIEKDNIPIAIFGIQIIREVPTLWMLSTDSLGLISRIFARNTREWINKMLVDYPTLTAFVDLRNKSSMRWLKFVGGKVVDTVFMGVDDMPFRKFIFGKI